MHRTSRALVVYARVPEIGRVKTRLQPRFTREQSLRLHVAMLDDTLERMRAACAGDATLWVSWSGAPPADPEPGAPARGLPWETQAGATLGERMLATITARCAGGFTHVVLIGSDTPHLPPSRVREAFDALDTHDVVLGPSEDGGYYLLGVRRPHISMFDGMPWGEPAVLSETRVRLRQAALSCHELERLYDIDTPEDALRLWKGPDPEPVPHRTRGVLRELFGDQSAG
ncbi:MAG: TIGR04282 family arsenosugar biosynthesis glycosyltransferase [Candidatus Polarisedimenticolia bacterium]